MPNSQRQGKHFSCPQSFVFTREAAMAADSPRWKEAFVCSWSATTTPPRHLTLVHWQTLSKGASCQPKHVERCW